MSNETLIWLSLTLAWNLAVAVGITVYLVRSVNRLRAQVDHWKTETHRFHLLWKLRGGSLSEENEH